MVVFKAKYSQQCYPKNDSSEVITRHVWNSFLRHFETGNQTDNFNIWFGRNPIPSEGGPFHYSSNITLQNNWIVLVHYEQYPWCPSSCAGCCFNHLCWYFTCLRSSLVMNICFAAFLCLSSVQCWLLHVMLTKCKRAAGVGKSVCSRKQRDGPRALCSALRGARRVEEQWSTTPYMDLTQIFHPVSMFCTMGVSCWHCVCVCVDLYLLHTEYQNNHYTSKASTFLQGRAILAASPNKWLFEG